ncbi:MAG: 23S rRNA (guanosine(2251)-2'-O)-methyltransferase RlmB [Clostridia bacterium]|nr:23S rRNA (guanosine(2251)-2'-O)-methyltransferase RlmB [Clostridia bacterium]
MSSVQRPPQEADDRTVFGRNPVTELLRSDAEVEKVFIRSGAPEGSLKMIAALAVKKGIPVCEASKAKLDAMCGGANHQGVAAVSSGIDYVSAEDVLAFAGEKNEKPFIVICDGINDPGNLGAILRSCEAAGVHGVIIPKRRSATLNGAAIKASAGAAEHINIVRVSNLAETAEKLKKLGVWLFACEAGGTDCREADFDLPLALILGGEDSGVSRLLKDKSDFTVSLPMKGKVGSLNVSCAAAVMLYRVIWSREK